MKNTKSLSVLFFAGILLIAFACKKTTSNTVADPEANPSNTTPAPVAESENKSAADAMNASLHSMIVYNDSLAHAVHNKHHYDAMFHHHDSVFIHHHSVYHHGDTLHHHSGWHHTPAHHHQHDSIVNAHHHIAH